MRHLGHHSTNGRSIGALNHLVQPGETQSANDLLLSDRRTNCRAYPLQADLAAVLYRLLRCHQSSSAALPRTPATNSLFFSFFSASKVALMTLCGFVVPIDLVNTFCTPAEVITARTAPPAITPVPSGAGFSSTIPD